METRERKNNNGKVWAWILVLLAIVILVLIATKVFKKDETKTEANASQMPESSAQVSQENNPESNPEDTANAENVVEEKYVTKSSDGSKVNTGSKINQTRKVGGLEFSDFQLTEQDNQSTLLATVKNTSGKDITDYTNLDITFYAEDGSEIVKIKGLVAPVKVGETTQLNAGLTQDIANAYDVKIEISKD